MFSPAWLVYRHSYAVEKEHDQVMSAYFKASQLMVCCHLPRLYIGLEYSLINNTWLRNSSVGRSRSRSMIRLSSMSSTLVCVLGIGHMPRIVNK